MSKALIGLGSNLGDRMDHMAAAIDALGALPHTQLLAMSRLYETDPVGYRDQPAFLNAVVLIESGLSPQALLGGCLGIEAGLGRRRSFRNAPRVIDLDLLLMEGIHTETAELQLPHPRMAQRAFVLVPLQDLFPDLQVWGWDFRPALAQCGRDGVRLFAEFLPGKNFFKKGVDKGGEI